jgi:PAB-dependent poly(A)-specific ribonuclease subunit 3
MVLKNCEHFFLIFLALFFAYNYHPGSETLEERYFGMLNQDYFVPEPVLWSYICQLISALRAIHSAGLACKVIVPSKILLTGKNKYENFLGNFTYYLFRIRVNCVGVQDVVNFDGNKNVPHYQHEDLIALGTLPITYNLISQDASSSPSHVAPPTPSTM